MENKLDLKFLKKPSRDNFFILDIDSTLVTTHQRNQAILDDWIKKFKSQFPKDCAALRPAQCQFGDYGLRNALERIAFIENEVGSKKSLDLFWKEHFFSNRYLQNDLATRGAVDWTQNLEELGIDFVYLTARHKGTMWEGTLSSMNQLGFPISSETLFLKEDLTVSDESYKSSLMEKLIAKAAGKKVWLIDNEPVVLHRVAEDHPSVNLIWFDSTHSGKKQPPEQALRIDNFTFSLDN